MTGLLGRVELRASAQVLATEVRAGLDRVWSQLMAGSGDWSVTCVKTQACSSAAETSPARSCCGELPLPLSGDRKKARGELSLSPFRPSGRSPALRRLSQVTQDLRCVSARAASVISTSRCCGFPVRHPPCCVLEHDDPSRASRIAGSAAAWRTWNVQNKTHRTSPSTSLLSHLARITNHLIHDAGEVSLNMASSPALTNGILRHIGRHDLHVATRLMSLVHLGSLPEPISLSLPYSTAQRDIQLPVIAP